MPTGVPVYGGLVAAHSLVKHFPLDSAPVWLGGRGRRVVRAVDKIDLEIFPGEIVGLIGESGSGKSTLGRALLRLHDVTSGQVIFDGQDITSLSGEPMRLLRRRMSMIFQNPYAAVNRRRRVRDTIAQPLLAHGVGSPVQRAQRVQQLLEAVGVPELAARYPHELSGGQLQRVVVARALATDPDFVVADEPTANLDVSVRAQIINLLADLRAERDIAMLFISHDLRTVSHVADRVAVMYLGRLVEVGPARSVTRDPQHPYTKRLIAALPQLRGRRSANPAAPQEEAPNPANPPSGCHYHPRCQFATDRCRVEAPRLELKADNRLAACHLLPTATVRASASVHIPR